MPTLISLASYPILPADGWLKEAVGLSQNIHFYTNKEASLYQKNRPI